MQHIILTFLNTQRNNFYTRKRDHILHFVHCNQSLVLCLLSYISRKPSPFFNYSPFCDFLDFFLLSLHFKRSRLDFVLHAFFNNYIEHVVTYTIHFTVIYSLFLSVIILGISNKNCRYIRNVNCRNDVYLG